MYYYYMFSNDFGDISMNESTLLISLKGKYDKNKSIFIFYLIVQNKQTQTHTHTYTTTYKA